jgi:Beta-lactamase
MTTDTIFSIASMTKPMVAVAALQLYEQGRLLIDDPLAKYFPKFANTQVAVAGIFTSVRERQSAAIITQQRLETINCTKLCQVTCVALVLVWSNRFRIFRRRMGRRVRTGHAADPDRAAECAARAKASPAAVDMPPDR